MLLKNVGMVAADTSRSKAYLQAMVRNNFLPEHVFLLCNPQKNLLPGQAAGKDLKVKKTLDFNNEDCWSEAECDLTEPVEVTLANGGISYKWLESGDINSAESVNSILNASQTVFIYSGYGGALLKKDILGMGKQFLHVHGGYLPDFKGSTTNYYSLIVNDTIGASSLFLNEKIDCGPVLRRRRFPAPRDCSQIDHVFDSAARAKVLIETLKDYVEVGDWRLDLPENNGGETYFIIHPVLKHIAILANQVES